METPEYLEAFRSIEQTGSQKQMTWSGKREQLTEKYAWAVPNKEAINFLVQESQQDPLFEVGAGNGYWAYEIQKNGGHIKPIDIDPPGDTWTTVQTKNYTDLTPSRVENLFLCWPPANSSMGADCITYLDPNTVYFIGKQESTITGDENLHTILRTEFDVVKRIQIPSWVDEYDTLRKFDTS